MDRLRARRAVIAPQKCPQGYHECSWKGRGKYKPCVLDRYKDLNCLGGNMTKFKIGATGIDISEDIDVNDKFDLSNHLVDYESDESDDDDDAWQ